MHELTLAKELVDTVERIKVKENAVEVLSVTVTLGALSGVDADALKFAFPLAAEGTSLERTTLVTRESPAAIRCEDCGWEGPPDATCVCCGACGSSRIRLSAGREFLISSVELALAEERTDGAAAPSGKGEEPHV